MSRASPAGTAMVGQATAAMEPAPRRWLHRVWGLPYIHARQDWAAVWPALAAMPREGIRLLDAGCGRGRWALELAARRPGWRVIGLDRDAAALRLAESARRKLRLDNLSFVQGDFADFRSLPVFDVVLSICSAQYLAGAGGGEALFKCFATALRPDGQLVLYVPRAAGEAPWLPFLPRPAWHDVFTAAQLRALCLSSGRHDRCLDGHLGRAGTMVKQIDMLAAGRWRRAALAAGLYGVECALAAWDRRGRRRPGDATLMWLLLAQRRSASADWSRHTAPVALMEAV
jgi:Precorrin-6B methylase 2